MNKIYSLFSIIVFVVVISIPIYVIINGVVGGFYYFNSLFPAIFGTFIISFISLIIAYPLGFLTAIYLKFYLKDGTYKIIITLSLKILSRTPTVIFTIVGHYIFSQYFGYSVIATILTILTIMYPQNSSKILDIFDSLSDEDIKKSYSLGSSTYFLIINMVFPKTIYKIFSVFFQSFAKVIGFVIPVLVTMNLNDYSDLNNDYFSTIATNIYFLLNKNSYYEVFFLTSVILLLIFIFNYISLKLNNKE